MSVEITACYIQLAISLSDEALKIISKYDADLGKDSPFRVTYFGSKLLMVVSY